MRIDGLGSRRLRLALLAIVLTAACSSERGRLSSLSDGTRPIIVAIPSDVVTLDPHNSNDIQSDQLIPMLYARLLRFDEQLRVHRDLAESWTVAPDGRAWTFTLRPGLRFESGAPLDATTVKESFERALDPAQKNVYAALFAMIDRIEVIDPQTVRFVTAYPFPAFDRTMAHMAASIVNPSLVRRFGRQVGRSVESVSGAGPYRLVRWIHDQEIVLQRNPQYWGTRPPTEEVTYRIIPDASSRRAALETGEVSVITAVSPADRLEIPSRAELMVRVTPSVGVQALAFNCTRWPFRDRRVRQAVTYAIDRRVIADGLFGGARVPTSALAPIINGYENLGEIPYDPGGARRLLAEAGLAGGFKTRIWTSPRFTAGVEIAEVIAAQLAQVGIEAAIEVVDWATWVTKLRGTRPDENPLELFLAGYGGSTADADWSLRPRFTTQPTNATNWGFYSNAEFDDVIVRAMRENDAGRRRALYRRAQEIIYLDDPAAAWLFSLDFVVAARRTVKGLSLSPLNLVTFENAVDLGN